MAKKIGIIGYFAIGDDRVSPGGGQGTKARNIYNILCRNFGESNVVRIDSCNWQSKKMNLLKQMFSVARTCDVVLILPAQNGIKVFLPFFACFKHLFHYRMVYPVVGGWLADSLEANKMLSRCIRNVDYILPETEYLAKRLQQFHCKRVEVMPVFSLREPISHMAEADHWKEPYVFATFSRVIPEKGIDEAIEAICEVNRKYGRVVCKLEICGLLQDDYKQHYEKLAEENAEEIRCRGILPDEMVISELAQYYMLLFPTFYEGEEFPATLCEAYMAGLPVIASDWKYNSELVDEGKTGFLFQVHNIDKLAEKIDYAIRNPEVVYHMRGIVLEKSKQYQPENVTKNMIQWIRIARDR